MSLVGKKNEQQQALYRAGRPPGRRPFVCCETAYVFKKIAYHWANGEGAMMSGPIRAITTSIQAAILGIGAIAGLLPAQAGPGGTPPPPTSPTIAVELGIFGLVLPGQTLFHSTYDSGKLFVGTHFFPRLWYKFSTGFGEAETMQFRHWTAASGAAYKVYDQNLQYVGDLSDAGLQLSKTKEYYIEVTADHATWAHFALEIRPAIDAFQNDAGNSEQNATDLGPLNKVITHKHQFYTYYTRAAPDMNGPSTTPGPLTPNFQLPDPAVSKGFYRFYLPRPSTLKVFTFNQDADTYVIRMNGESDSTVVQNGAQFQLMRAGIYIVEIVDKHTTVSGSVETRDPRIENFENQSFELLVVDSQDPPAPPPANPPPGNAGGVEVSPLGPPPKPACITIGNQRINCP